MAGGRKSKYSPDLAAEIVKLLQSGCIIEDVCSKVGISPSTYHAWMVGHSEFSEMVKRAKAEANVGATLSLRKAMMPHDVHSNTTKTITETRLRKVRGKEGVSEVPYEYKKVERSDTITNEFDWRAALEFLKRRDPDNWSEKLIIRVDPAHLDLLHQLGFDSPSDAWQAMMDNAAKEFAIAHSTS